MRTILALSGLAVAASSSSSCSSKVVDGPSCPADAVCGEACCTSEQECFQGSCLPKCATQIHCGELCCAADEECSAGLTCEKVTHVGNDNCGSPRELKFTAGVAREHGTTTDAHADVLLTCATERGGFDVVYTFTLAKPQKVTVSAQAEEGSAILPVLALRSVCGTNTNLACAAPPAAGGATTLEVGKVPAGKYFLWVAGNVAGAAGAGPFGLSVTLADADQPPANDTCVNATLIDLTANGRAVIRGDLAPAKSDTTSRAGHAACPTEDVTPGPDVVYRIEVPGTRSFSARLAFDNRASMAMAGLYLRKSCDAAAEEVGCPQDNQGFAALQVAALAPGTYYLFVDTDLVAGEPFTLAVNLGAAPANDSCATGAQAITLDAAGKAAIEGDTALANNDSSGAGTCAGMSSDVVYKLHLDSDKSVTITVTPAGLNFIPVVYVRSTCAGTGSLGCSSSTGARATTLQLDRLPEGDWFIWVSGIDAPYWGGFTLSVSTADVNVPPNDVCAHAMPLTLDAARKTASVKGSTTGGWDDYQGTTCGPRDPTMDGPDLVYTVTLTETAALSVTLERDLTTPSALLPAVYVRTQCASTAVADEKACARADWMNPGSVTVQVPSAEANTYFIIVDGTSGTAGAFTLDVTARPPIANDTCAHPRDIPIDATTGIGSVRGDTSLANDDGYGSCQSQFTTGPDLVYQFTLSQDRAVAIDLTPDAGEVTYKPVLFVRQSCDQRTTQALNGCVAATTGGAVAHLSFSALAQGTYFVWVDGNTTAGAGTSGPFTLTVTTAAPPAAPAGDTCATEIPLTLAATADPAITRATATGDTSNARDNAQGLGLCEGSAAGDLVYSVTLDQASKLKAVVTPDAASAFQPVVYIRSVCASSADADQLAGGVPAAAGRPATATANSVPQGTYWIWVDGLANTGAFALEVTATAPAAGPANDNCSAPQAITFTGTTATVTGTTVAAQNDSASGTSGYGFGGGDVVYSITTTNTGPRSLTASVVGATGAPASFLPVVIIRERCGSLADEFASAQAGSATQPASTWPIRIAAAGTYFVWVDSGQPGPAVPATPGPFILNLTLEVPNDRCAGAEDLTMSTAAVTGDTTGAIDQYGTTGGFSATCAAALGSTTRTPGPEVAYVYFAMRSFTVTVIPEAGFDPVVWVTRTMSTAQCGVGTNCVAAANSAGAGGTESVSVTVTNGDQYFIFVDSAQASAVGKFAIQIL